MSLHIRRKQETTTHDPEVQHHCRQDSHDTLARVHHCCNLVFAVFCWKKLVILCSAIGGCAVDCLHCSHLDIHVVYIYIKRWFRPSPLNPLAIPMSCLQFSHSLAAVSCKLVALKEFYTFKPSVVTLIYSSITMCICIILSGRIKGADFVTTVMQPLDAFVN